MLDSLVVQGFNVNNLMQLFLPELKQQIDPWSLKIQDAAAIACYASMTTVLRSFLSSDRTSKGP